jgi:hypothetical protein
VQETDHLTPSSAEVKNGGAIPPLPVCLKVRTSVASTTRLAYYDLPSVTRPTHKTLTDRIPFLVS